jgi:hypothetical protein
MVTVPAADCVATGVEGSAVSHKENHLLVLVTSGHIKGTAILALTVVREVADDMILMVGGFGGNFRQSEFRAGYGEQRQRPEQSRELGINMQGHGNVHGGASHCNPEVQTHGQGQSQGNMGQQSAGTAGGGGSQSSAKVAEDTSSIPASMMHLFQQFLESIGKKEVAHTTLPQGEIKEKKEQAKGEGEVPTKEIIESSAQGEARGNNMTNDRIVTDA